jgi:uncharacterized spore protein YtfJ
MASNRINQKRTGRQMFRGEMRCSGFLPAILICFLASQCFSPPALAATDQARAESSNPSADTLEELKSLYSTEIILGQPLEVEGVKIIPLATIGIGFGRRDASKDQGELRGAGGVVSPVGVLVVSNKGVQLIPISKGFLEQLGSALAPIMLEFIRRAEEAPEDGKGRMGRRANLASTLAAIYGFLPENGLKFGFFPWPPFLIVIFILGWLASAVLITVFLPDQISEVAKTSRERPLHTGLTGLLGFGGVLFLAILFAASVIGLPLTVLLLVLTWVLSLLGVVGIAWIVGEKCIAAFSATRHSGTVYVVIGGILLAILRVIPFFGWVIWFLLGVFGFGGVVLTHWRKMRARELRTSS